MKDYVPIADEPNPATALRRLCQMRIDPDWRMPDWDEQWAVLEAACDELVDPLQSTRNRAYFQSPRRTIMGYRFHIQVYLTRPIFGRSQWRWRAVSGTDPQSGNRKKLSNGGEGYFNHRDMLDTIHMLHGEGVLIVEVAK